MNKKSTLITLVLVVILVLTNLTCDLLNRNMELTLPPDLFDGDPDLSRAKGIVELQDYEGTDVLVELAIVPADQDAPENVNDDSDDLSKFLLVPPYVTITENTLFVEFECKAIDTTMTDPYYKDVTVKASTLHFNDAFDTVRIYDVATGPTPIPTDVPTDPPEVTDGPTTEPTNPPKN